MARLISQLTAATTPLAGTEVAWIEQSGLPKKVAVSDLGGQYLPLTGGTLTGNLTIDTDGVGPMLLVGDGAGAAEDTLIEFGTDRPWYIRQGSAGSGTYLKLQQRDDGKRFFISSAAGADQFQFTPADTADPYFRIFDRLGTDYATFSHDGTDFNTTFTNTVEWNITGLPIKIIKTSGPHMTFRDSDHTGDTVNSVGWLSFEGNDGVRMGFVGFGSSGTKDITVASDIGDVSLAGTNVHMAGDTVGAFKTMAGTYGSVSVTGAQGTASWEGYDINSEMVFMSHVSENRGGIYSQGQGFDGWVIQYNRLGTGNTDIYHNNAVVLQTGTSSVTVPGTLNVTTAVNLPEDTDAPYGIHGGYSDAAATTFGATMWAIDTSWSGGAAGANSAITNVYGTRWHRSTHANVNANIGEGMYVYTAGVLEGGIGTAGIYSAAAIQCDGNLNITGDIIGTGTYTDVRAVGAGASGIRVLNSASAVQGYLYHDGSGAFGLLGSTGAWAVRVLASGTQVQFYDNNVVEARTADSNAADGITGLEVLTYWGQATYQPVGIATLPHTNITAAVNLSETYMLRAIRWTSGAANLAVTALNDSGMRVNCWGMIWNESGTNKRFTAGTGVTIYHFDGAGGLTKTATQFLDIADGGNLTWTKISDTLFRTWGIGVTG